MSESCSEERSSIKYSNQDIQKQKDLPIKNNNLQDEKNTFRKEEAKNIFINNQQNVINNDQAYKSQIKSQENQDRTRDQILMSPHSPVMFSIDKDILNLSYSQQINKDSQFQLFDKRDQKKGDNDRIKNDTLNKNNIQSLKHNLQLSKLQSNNKTQSEKFEISQYGMYDSSNLQQQQAKKFIIKKGIEFLVIKNVKKFMSNIKKKSRSLLFKALSKPQFSLINDASSSYDYYFESGYFNLNDRTITQKLFYRIGVDKFIDRISHIKLLSYIIQPESFFKLAWDIFMVFFNIAFIAYVPLYHVFLELFPEHFNQYALCIKICLVILLLEIFVNLNSGIFKNGLVIKDRAQILKKQYKNLIKDILIFVFLMLSINDDQDNPLIYFNYVVFLKISDIGSKLEELESKFRLNDTMSNLFKLFKLQFFIFFIAHIICCIFLKIGLTQSGQSWIIYYNLQYANFQEQYLNSLYFCLITMTTIGYGDITPKTITEKSFILVVSVIACAIFGYTFSQISEIVKDLEKKKKDFNRNMQIINREMNNKGISITLQHKVRKYFEYQKKVEERKSFMQADMIENLPQILKEEVLLDVNKQILGKHYIFSKLSLECMQEISLIFHQKKYFPGEVIFNEGDREDNLYFIWSGEVNITKQYQSDSSTSQETTLRILKKKDFFGQVGFFIDNPNPYTAKAKTFLNLSYIKRIDFFNCLQKYPKDYEKICYIRDSISLYKQISFLETKCFSCGDYNHYLQQCPSVHLVASVNQREFKQFVGSQDSFPTSRKLKKYNALQQLERFYMEIIEFWNQKVNEGGESESILDEINEILENQKNKGFEINTINQISEYSDENSSDKLEQSKSAKQKYTINTFSSKDKRKQNSQNNYNSSSHFGSHRNINNQNNFSNQLNVKEENIDITSEQSIQNIQELQLKKYEKLDSENNNESQIEVFQSNQNIGLSKTSSINVKKPCKSDLSVLPEADDNNCSIQQINNQDSVQQKDDQFLPSVSFTQNIILEIQNQNKLLNKDEDSNNSKLEYQDQNTYNKKSPLKMSQNNDQNYSNRQISNQFEYLKEEDIDNSQTFPSQSIIHRKNMAVNNYLAEIRAHKAQFMQDDSPYRISPLYEESFSSNQINSPLRRHGHLFKKNQVKKQPSIELDIFSPEAKIRDGQRKLTKRKSLLSKQVLIIDNNQNVYQNNNLNYYQTQAEEMQSQRKITINKGSSVAKLKESLVRQSYEMQMQNEQIIQLNTQNLISYIKFMQDNKLINPILENKTSSIVELSKKKKTTYIPYLAANSDYEINSANQKEEKMQSSRNIQNNRKKLSITSSLKQKAEKVNFEKGKTGFYGDKNQFFPVNEEIVKRNTCEMDINLLIYRKQLVWNSEIQRQMNGIIELDEEDDIDALKSYEIYFPQGNIENVLVKYNNKQTQLLKKQIPQKSNKLRHDSKASIYKIRETRLSKIILQQPSFAGRQSISKKF
ncbi:cyclic nucleotide-binding domain protein (macronuclear) [Tetrahymena thermophila SB210]|uniref:Cyclic nucleotide-binding domain protein n=1 Tax=Tetrahymena thermophila (strain SB210) TaxID=312017 RepID=Q22U44_TETTS|nr:cyclic nucleotide-binding domain protein [Tetrahymena thermophila SB210]EAR88843.3 cyclic nucleotide-binding domain protein [Tetrahymena thermophila SB210]|eukprot:XP_001009088.3 cyclic nucleotide-binding domain protein [Tetrahymena thermophila SB210]